ncbi:acyltransferase family protein [Colwellia hornerae]|uniref:Acyltransferase n=1 Tax=Colwellia hornerae TaxID=89402 RepID=A0A5C6Q2C7_9GAMM|nr:acyltransferase family protein [Colwellia hornerae]TWX52493.1 acyltransferase [Colwellia hornerae]TWX58322.1 acyltransferase [Colwellia hornerae]TWX62738.1 acyltransferase [Colwellia hornerae]
MQFRKDINGLRAIAVIAVVLFHFNASWMPGGFAGVDVFFVISGFLMTRIIFGGIEQENFSLLKFYVARANRIIPALAALCLVLLIFGWFYLTPLDYKILGKHAGSSMVFLSNIISWQDSGYFDVTSKEKWLLHTWSLSAEWQFYIIYPLVLFAMQKFISIKTMKATILFGTAIGFIFCIIATYKWPDASYYLLPTRAWEMMFGGVAYLYPFTLQDKRKKLVERVGLIFIMSSYLLISKGTPWPGYLAIFPVLGTFLVIQAQRKDSLITNNVIFQKLGSWSYSIYLWHWPLVVAIYYFSLNEVFIYIGIALSLLLGFLSNKYIENIKFRNNFNDEFSYLKCKPIYMSLIIGLLGFFTYILQGIDTRFDVNSEFKVIKKELLMPLRGNGYCFYYFGDDTIADEKIGANCYLGIQGKTSNTLLFGDSYAGHYDPFFDDVFKANNASFQSIVTSWCNASFTDNFVPSKTHAAYKQCLMNRKYLKDNIHKYKNIILAGSWDSVLGKGFFKDIEQVIDKSAKLGINVFIMAAPYRYQKNPLKEFYESIYLGDSFDINTMVGNDILMTKANLLLKKLSEKYVNVYFIDRSLLYETKNTFDVNGMTVPYSLDGAHISILGSKYSAKYFMGQDKYNEIMSKFNFD